jgi:hypothetical protein
MQVSIWDQLDKGQVTLTSQQEAKAKSNRTQGRRDTEGK